MPILTKNSIKWNAQDWLGGQLPHSDATGAKNRMLGNGFTDSNCDPLRNPGYLLPGFMDTDYTNIGDTSAYLMNLTVGGSTNRGFGIEFGAKLHRFNYIDHTIDNTGDWPHTITGTGAIVGQDNIVYTIGSTRYLFYSYNDSNVPDGDIGRFDLGSTFDDDYMSTVPAGAARLGNNPHPMIIGDDDIMYIGDGRDLQAFDGQTGASGTYSAQVLTLPLNFVITSFAKLPNYLVVYGYEHNSSIVTTTRVSSTKQQNKAFFWDYLSEDPTFVYDLPGNYVNAGFQFKGTVGCFTEGHSNDIYNDKFSRLLIFDGQKFDEMRIFDDRAPSHGGVESVGNVIYWNSTGNIYRFGTPYPGIGNSSFNQISAASSPSNSGFGALKILFNNEISASSDVGVGGGLQHFTTNYNTGDFTTTLFPILGGQKQQVKPTMVKITWDGPTPGNTDGRTFTLKLLTDRATDGTALNEVTVFSAKQPSGDTSLPQRVEKFETDSSDLAFLPFSEIGISGTWQGGNDNDAAPGIGEIEVFFEPININP